MLNSSPDSKVVLAYYSDWGGMRKIEEKKKTIKKPKYLSLKAGCESLNVFVDFLKRLSYKLWTTILNILSTMRVWFLMLFVPIR